MNLGGHAVTNKNEYRLKLDKIFNVQHIIANFVDLILKYYFCGFKFQEAGSPSPGPIFFRCDQ